MVKDGYEWIVNFDNNFLRKISPLRNLILLYFNPFFFENYKYGLVYRFLGVDIFGKLLPTGGIKIRRLTKNKMQSYTLKRSSLSAAKEFRYKSCLFETLHLPFLVFLIWRALWWYFEHNNLDQAIELLFVNAVFNIYPIMHQRYTRLRVAKLIDIKNRIKNKYKPVLI